MRLLEVNMREEKKKERRLSGSKLSLSSIYHPILMVKQKLLTVSQRFTCVVSLVNILDSGLSGYHGLSIVSTPLITLQSGATPFQLVYGRGRDLPGLLSYSTGSTRTDVVDKALKQRDALLYDAPDWTFTSSTMYEDKL